MIILYINFHLKNIKDFLWCLISGISNQLEQLVTALRLGGTPNDQIYFKKYNMINYLFVDCVEGLKVR